MKLTLRACAASVGRSSIGDLVLAGDVLRAGDLCCLSCAVKHCHKAVWYILSCSDCFADCLLSPAIAPKPSSFASLLVADACLNLQQAYLNMSLECKCGTAPSCPQACLHNNAYRTPQFNSALSALATLNAPMQTKIPMTLKRKCHQHTSCQSRCNSQSTLLPCSLDFPASSLPLMAEW